MKQPAAIGVLSQRVCQGEKMASGDRMAAPDLPLGKAVCQRWEGITILPRYCSGHAPEDHDHPGVAA